jgi:hypothetical protein
VLCETRVSHGRPVHARKKQYCCHVQKDPASGRLSFPETMVSIFVLLTDRTPQSRIESQKFENVNEHFSRASRGRDRVPVIVDPNGTCTLATNGCKRVSQPVIRFRKNYYASCPPYGYQQAQCAVAPYYSKHLFFLPRSATLMREE